MNNDIEREFNLGGSVEKALSGSYELKVGDVLKEAWVLQSSTSLILRLPFLR